MSSSFFERGKGFLDKGRPLLFGFHQGTWEYRRPSDCAQLMVCQRCTANPRGWSTAGASGTTRPTRLVIWCALAAGAGKPRLRSSMSGASLDPGLRTPASR